MTGTGLHRVLVLMLGLFVAGFSLLLAGPGAIGLVCGPSWSTLASDQHINKPSAIATIANNDIWIVGSIQKPEHGIRTGAEHWNGSNWSRVPTPDVGNGANALNGVDALASNDVWAVGYSGKKTLIERWNGSQWRVVTSSNAGTTGENTLTSVDALSGTNAWAAGSSHTATSRKSLIQRWNGISWSIDSSPNPGSLSNSLLGVAAVASNDIWAVGFKSSGSGYRSPVLHYNGSGWSEVTVPTFGDGGNVLTNVSAAGPENVWASGYYVDGTQHKTLTLRYNGTTWSQVPSPNGADRTSVLTAATRRTSTVAV
jgi:hypothetical protein